MRKYIKRKIIRSVNHPLPLWRTKEITTQEGVDQHSNTRIEYEHYREQINILVPFDNEP